MVDQVVVEFETVGDVSTIQSVTNWTSYNISRDFFNPIDGFTLVCEDDRSEQLAADLKIGQRLKFLVNNCCILIGYIDTIELSYMRGGKGKSLTIHGRDICGILMDAHVYPNLGKSPITTTSTITTPIIASQVGTLSKNGNSIKLGQDNSPNVNQNFNGGNFISNGATSFTPASNGTKTTIITNVVNYQFNTKTTLKEALTAIFINGLTPITNLIIDDGFGALTFATGFGIGNGTRTKTGRGLKKNFNAALERLCKPEKGESYLKYGMRLVKHAGGVIKCVPGTDNTLFVGPPIYDRTNFTPFSIQHSYVNGQSNNVHDGRMKVSYKDQPSVIIGEATSGHSTFRKQTFKVVCINELTGYIPGSTSLNIDTAIPNIGEAIGILTTGIPGTGQTTTKQVATTTTSQEFLFSNAKNQSGISPILLSSANTAPILIQSSQTTFNTVSVPPSGYYLLPPNTDLYNCLNRTILNTQTNFSRPFYYEDYNAQSPEELMLGVSELMADFQDKFFELEYRMDNHSQNNVVWAPNIMCTVSDDAFGPANNSANNVYWIKKVNFTKSRSGGTETNITLTLPYTHCTNFSDN